MQHDWLLIDLVLYRAKALVCMVRHTPSLPCRVGWKPSNLNVDDFIRFAKEHSRLTFLVTRIGCGIAGFRDEEIAPLFTDAIEVENIILPMEFVENISPEGKRNYYLELLVSGKTFG